MVAWADAIADTDLLRPAVMRRSSMRGIDDVGMFPARDSRIRLVGAVLAEQHDEWNEGDRYLGFDILAKIRLTMIDDGTINGQRGPDPARTSTHRVPTRSRGHRLAPLPRT